MLTTEEVAAIHRAMTAAKGHRPTAAAALGLTVEELREKTAESDELKILWPLGPAISEPTTAEAFDRKRSDFELVEPVDLGGVTPREAAVAAALARQEDKLQRFDWEGLGVREPKTVKLMRQFEQGVGRGVVRLLDAMCGGMGYCFAQVSARFALAAEKLDDPNVLADPAIYAYWHNMFMDYAREMKGFNKEATAAAHTRLLIADRARKMQAATDKMKKPGWQRVKPVASANPTTGGTNGHTGQ